MEKKTRGRPRKVVEQNATYDELHHKNTGKVATSDALAAAEEDANAFVDVFIVKSCTNPKWKQGIDKKANKCFVAVPKTLIHLLDGKWVKAARIDGTEENHYNFVA